MKLRIGGGLITLIVVLGSVLTGWCPGAAAVASLPMGMAQHSGTDPEPRQRPGGSQPEGQRARPWWMRLPSAAEGDLEPARRNLSWIVGRDVQSLDRDEELLRAAAETASENAVDGVFAPLFWMVNRCPAVDGPARWSWSAGAGLGFQGQQHAGFHARVSAAAGCAGWGQPALASMICSPGCPAVWSC